MSFVLLVSSCNKRPVANFSIDDTTPDSDQLVNFTNLSADGKTYVWDFGDGTTSTEMSPSHAYSEPGAYLVELTVYSKKNKKVDSHADLIEVTQNMFAQMTHIWSYDSVATSNFTNGMLTNSNSFALSDFFSVHNVEFKDNYTYETNLDGSISVGPWTLNVQNETFTIDGETYSIVALSSNSLYYSITSTTVSGPDTYTEVNATYLSR